MKIAARNGQPALVWLVALLLFAGLACAQAGEVLTPAEATERAAGPLPGTAQEGSTAGDFQVGDTAELTGRSFLVNLFDAPGGRISAGQERGAEVTIQQVTELDGEIWYQIKAGTGTGWVKADALVPIEGQEETANGAEGGGEPTGGEDAGGIATGDMVYLTGRSFLVNLLDEPGGRIIAGQERGARVTVLASTTENGSTWYQIDAPTGQGWVPEENITTEAP
ncbi:MAG TPA: GW dipeptide domain-containing protein [Candidatus Binatia bacterium]|jgi:hypothetical protein|nr:GW dipeptide domain-containing protein [Candidatus Binatia bacterium]